MLISPLINFINEKTISKSVPTPKITFCPALVVLQASQAMSILFLVSLLNRLYLLEIVVSFPKYFIESTLVKISAIFPFSTSSASFAFLFKISIFPCMYNPNPMKTKSTQEIIIAEVQSK